MYVLTFALAGHFPYHILTGGGAMRHPGVSTLGVAALRNKDKSIALGEYSRFVLYFSPSGQHLTGSKVNFRGNRRFFN